MGKWITLPVLIIAAVFDCKWRQIPGWLPVTAGAGGILYALGTNWSGMQWGLWAAGSAVFLAVCKMTQQAVGYGDAMMWSVTALYLGITDNAILWMISFQLIFLFSAAGLLLKKISPKTALPFLPFLAAVHGILTVMGG